MSTTPSTTAADDFTSPSVLNVQRRLPSRAPTAWMVPARSPTNTVPLLTAGEDSPMKPLSPVAYLHRSAPVSRSSARSSPFDEPPHTPPSRMAADDSNASPAAYVQRTVRAA